jgi:hypothetical protein
MRRRDFIAGLTWAWSAAAGAQDHGLRRIGILMPITAEDPTGSERDAVFRHALEERGWIEGRNLRIDRRWAKFDHDLVRKYATELVALEPEVILAGGGGVVAELQKEPFEPKRRSAPFERCRFGSPSKARATAFMCSPKSEVMAAAPRRMMVRSPYAPRSGAPVVEAHEVETAELIAISTCAIFGKFAVKRKSVEAPLGCSRAGLVSSGHDHPPSSF